MWKPKHAKCPWGETGCANRRWVPARQLKIAIGLLSWACGSILGWKKANKWNTIKLKHMRNGENVIVCGKPNSLCCEVGDVISKLCASQATKNGSVDCSAEPLRAHWDEEMAKKWDTETKHVQTYSDYKIKDELAKMQFCWNWNKIVGRKVDDTP